MFLLVARLGMEVYGAGLATAVSQAVSFLILLFMYGRMAQSRISVRFISRDLKVYLSVLRVGLPSLIRQSLNAVTTGILNNVTKPFGDEAIAAMSIVNRYSSFLMCVGLGMGQGFQPVASFNYQAKKYSRVKKGLLFTMTFGIVFIGGFSLVSIIFSDFIIQLFQSDPGVVAVGSRAMRFAAFGMMFMPLSVPVNMLYQSIQQPNRSSLLSMIRSGAVTIPLLLLGTPFLGILCVQTAQPTADIIAGIISLFFVAQFIKTLPKDR